MKVAVVIFVGKSGKRGGRNKELDFNLFLGMDEWGGGVMVVSVASG